MGIDRIHAGHIRGIGEEDDDLCDVVHARLRRGQGAGQVAQALGRLHPDVSLNDRAALVNGHVDGEEEAIPPWPTRRGSSAAATQCQSLASHRASFRSSRAWETDPRTRRLIMGVLPASGG